MSAPKRKAAPRGTATEAEALYLLGNLTPARWQELHETVPLSVQRLVDGLVEVGYAAPPKAFLP